MYPWGKREFSYMWVKLSLKPLSYSVFLLKTFEQECNLWYCLQWKHANAINLPDQCHKLMFFFPIILIVFLSCEWGWASFKKDIGEENSFWRTCFCVHVQVAWNRFVQFLYLYTSTIQNEILCLWAYFWETRQGDCIMSGRSKWVTVLFMRSFVSFKSLLPRCWHWTWVISNKQVLQKIESLEGRKSRAQERRSPTTCFSRCIGEALLIALFPVADFS